MGDDLERRLDDLEDALETRAFRDEARQFERALKKVRKLSRTGRQAYWDRYQSLWERHKAYLAERAQRSETLVAQYASRLRSLDFGYDGGPILQSFASWERVGDKVRQARSELKEVVAAVRADASLLRRHRQELWHLIKETRSGIRSAQETAFSVHGQRAGELLNEAASAVATMRPRAARPILKAASSEIRSLYLNRDDRHRFRSALDDLWSELKARKAEEQRAWRERQRSGLGRLIAARDKAAGALARVRANIDSNEERLASARTAEFADRVSGWIQEGEEKARDIEASIDELDAKIRDAEERLRR